MLQNTDNPELLREGEKLVSVGDRVKLISDGHGLAWGTDAYLLSAYLRPAGRLCELGCGGGVVSFLAAAHNKAKRVVAFELNEAAFDRARRAVPLNRLWDTVSVFRRDIREIRYTDSECEGRFDAVAANPPYIAHPGMTGRDAEANDARHENHGGISDFCAAAARILRHRGSFFCVWRPARTADLFAAMRNSGIEPKRARFVFPDAGSSPSLLLCEGVLGAGPGLDIAPPLLLFRDPPGSKPRRMTAEAEKIYETCSFGERNVRH